MKEKIKLSSAMAEKDVFGWDENAGLPQKLQQISIRFRNWGRLIDK